MAGNWSRTATVIDIEISDAMRKEAANTEGCDLSEIEGSKGQAWPLGMIISPNSETGGTLQLLGEHLDYQSVPFSYNEGNIKASVSDEGGSGLINMNVNQDGSMSDSFNIGCTEKCTLLRQLRQNSFKVAPLLLIRILACFLVL